MSDRLSVSFPAKPEYILPLRLFLSGVATRMDFDVNTIEDIRSAVSEGCILLLGGACGTLHADAITGDALRVELWVEGGCVGGQDQELSLVMLEAMADKLEIEKDGERYLRVALEFHKEESKA